MDILEFIKSRRSTRKFTDKKIETEKLNQILEAGRYAPSGGNSQSTHFLVIQNKDVLVYLQNAVQKAFASMEEYPGMYRSMANSIRAAQKGNYVFHYHAPVLILCANQKNYGNNIADVACALENMMLMANALDLGSCWINQLKWLNEDSEINKYLVSIGMDSTERIYGALAVGYPDTDDGLPLRTPAERTGNAVTFIHQALI